MQTEKMSLEDLLYRCALKDGDALAILYQQTSAKLFALVLRIVARKEVAEEILQDSFVNIWNRCDQFREDRGTALTWMIGIVRNRSIDWIRRNPKGREVGDEALEDVPDPAQNPDMSAVEASEAQALLDCMDELEGAQRNAIVQVYYQGLTHQEYASGSGQPLGTIKSWIRRGLQRLKGCLEL